MFGRIGATANLNSRNPTINQPLRRAKAIQRRKYTSPYQITVMEIDHH
jgi:hypothetical protein